MLLHDVKRVIPLLDQHTSDLIKKASLQEDYPISTKADIFASAVVIEYLEKIACEKVPADKRALVKRAAEVANLNTEISVASMAMQSNHNAIQMEKAASAIFDHNYLRTQIQDHLSNSTGGIEKAAGFAEDLASTGVALTFEEACLAGQVALNKEAAINGLVVRANMAAISDAAEFVKIARALNASTEELGPQGSSEICKQVAALDKSAGLAARGFNPYKEFFVKSAGVTVQLCGKAVPYEKIQKLGSARIGAALGKEVSSVLFKDPAADKQVLETLPLDLQQLLCSLLAGV